MSLFYLMGRKFIIVYMDMPYFLFENISLLFNEFYETSRNQLKKHSPNYAMSLNIFKYIYLNKTFSKGIIHMVRTQDFSGIALITPSYVDVLQRVRGK